MSVSGVMWTVERGILRGAPMWAASRLERTVLPDAKWTWTTSKWFPSREQLDAEVPAVRAVVLETFIGRIATADEFDLTWCPQC